MKRRSTMHEKRVIATDIDYTLTDASQRLTSPLSRRLESLRKGESR